MYYNTCTVLLMFISCLHGPYLSHLVTHFSIGLESLGHLTWKLLKKSHCLIKIFLEK